MSATGGQQGLGTEASATHKSPPSLGCREQVPTDDEAVIASSHEHGLSLRGQVEVPGSQERGEPISRV